MQLESPKVEYIEHMGGDTSVVNAARVSFAKEVASMSQQDEKLIKYLATNGHWSPFAHTAIKFRICNPIFLARQLVKHQVGGVWNEESRRYISDEPTFYIPNEWHQRPEGYIKQGSGAVFDPTTNTFITNKVMKHYSDSLDLYNDLLGLNVAPEQARMVLPLGTNTHWIWTGSVYFWARVYNLRHDAHAQRDLGPFVNQLNTLMLQYYPISWTALTTTPKAVALSIHTTK